jgi:D-methionine transport system ATP-binding protein
MDGGQIVEQGAVDGIFADPQHPTTQSLLADEFIDYQPKPAHGAGLEG